MYMYMHYYSTIGDDRRESQYVQLKTAVYDNCNGSYMYIAVCNLQWFYGYHAARETKQRLVICQRHYWVHPGLGYLDNTSGEISVCKKYVSVLPENM